jgi:hypothetical protein
VAHPQTMFRDGVLNEPYLGGEPSAVALPATTNAVPIRSAPRITIGC